MDYLIAGLQTLITSILVGTLVYRINRKVGARLDQQDEDIKCAKKKSLEQAEITANKQVALESGMRSVIRASIIQSYDKAMDREYVPPYERESILSSYHDYKVLGGNGMVDHLMEEMESLGSVQPVKIRKTKSHQTQTTL